MRLVLFLVRSMNISPGPVNIIPNMGKKKPIAVHTRNSCTIAEIIKEASRALSFDIPKNSTYL
jgi:hypothetical protein